MNDIDPLYYNHFGVAFQWKGNTPKDSKKVQMVFRDMGLLLSITELVQFSKKIKGTLSESEDSLCNDCSNKEACRVMLLETPAPQVSLAMSLKELYAVHDLVEGTLFQLNLDDFLNGICRV